MPDRTTIPDIKDAVDFNLTLKPCDKYALTNGAPVYAVNAGAEEVLQLEFVFFAGNCFEEKNTVAAATNYLLKNGTRTKNAFSINEHFEYYGAYLNRACYSEHATITLHCLSKHLNVLLPVVKEILTEAIFPEEELEIFKQNCKQRLSVNLQKCDFIANRLIDQKLYGADHPYGKFSSMEDYEALHTDDLKKFYADHYVNGKAILFAAGKLPADFATQLNNFFGELNINQPANIPQNVSLPATEKKSRINNDPNGVQGAIRIARSFPGRYHPDFKKVMVLNNLLGGFFGSRLMANIREEKGYTYGIHSFIQNHVQDTAWVISTEAGKDVCEATIDETYKEMKLLRDTLVDEEELLLVKNYMMGLNLGDLDGPFQIIARWKNLILNNLDEKYFYDSMNDIKNISAAEIKDLANKYLVPEQFFELVVI
ncbi:MAG: insulinase family protein [Chitinophagaceae bacterium]|nr:insulinase family protein [Chitinophagaceae bacterium]